jgi:hypothetical protein
MVIKEDQLVFHPNRRLINSWKKCFKVFKIKKTLNLLRTHKVSLAERI